MSLESITIFTDGSSRGNPGPGGFGAIVIADGKVTELGGRETRTTNNRMELQAAIAALSSLSSLRIKDEGLRILIYSDSSYLINGITKWIHGWQKNGWKTKAKQDVENRDLWEKLIEISRNKEIQWKQIGGHVGVIGNERCDEIATAFADGKPVKLYSGVLENYSIKNILDVGSRTGKGLTFLPTPACAEAPACVSRTVRSAGRQGQTLRSPERKKRSRARAYSYVSMVDGKLETHKTWADCEKRVKGKQAKYKKALNREEETETIRAFS